MSFNAYLQNIIRNEGPISIARFMQEVLGHKEHGYYTTQEVFGVKGDFTTSPEISQMFGEMIGLWAVYAWQEMGSPPNVALVEFGPGRGTLMKDLLRATKHIAGFHEAISIHLVEISSSLKQAQAESLDSYKNKLTWHKNFSTLPNKPIIVIANEFFDALPIHQYIKLKDLWYETKVSIVPNSEELHFNYYPLHQIDTTFLIVDYSHVPDGGIIETSPYALQVMQDLAERILNYGGAALIIDYGYDLKPTDKRNFISSLQAVKNHKFHPIFSQVGEADISAHVDFASLKAVGFARGLKCFGAIGQGDFLNNIGINIRTDQLLRNSTPSQKLDIITALDRLTAPTKMGELFKVIAISEKKLDNLIGFKQLNGLNHE
jgi:NADH dehydrogenase [ubiquinone] 1 alpha subcomplex assembly factor 7